MLTRGRLVHAVRGEWRENTERGRGEMKGQRKRRCSGRGTNDEGSSKWRGGRGETDQLAERWSRAGTGSGDTSTSVTHNKTVSI